MNKKIYLYLFNILVPLISFGISLFIAFFYKSYFSYLHPIIFIAGILLLIIFCIKYKIKFWSIIINLLIFIILMFISWGSFSIISYDANWHRRYDKAVETGEIKPCVPNTSNRMGLDC